MREQTTVTIDKITFRKLEKLATSSGVTKKEFLAHACIYFERYGINPVIHESPAQEMQKLIKRVDQVVAFIRTQEKEKLNPMFEAITTTEARLSVEIDNLVKVQHMKEISNVWSSFIENLQQKQSRDKELFNGLANAMFLIAQTLENNNDKAGLSEKIKKLFTNG
ncbi:BfmA/BtgA family mobilization protein [Dysgonomonas sp. 25]|uniref:BfmA/BtgA family mobilization protein n=1 Tax=Dysgonomonas sp. 25 TaxID=2302933 RepID=UPI0013D0D0C4|nr:BfmA/BtgA family mobilization protein [Dysgonomonas sp. 25]NDV68932.1 hypothetical protein [Dysgonomonas sp. 25]